MITSKNALKEVLEYERNKYFTYMFPTLRCRLLGCIKHEPIMSIWKWQKAARKSDYYFYKSQNGGNLLDKFLNIYWAARKNRMGERLGLELRTANIGKGLFIYHFGGGIVSIGNIGENVHFHGNNCIGNGGPGKSTPPTLGNNIRIGVGAKIIGNIRIADDVKIAAGAVVITDIDEPGCTVAGIPAKIVRHANTPL